MDSFFIILGWTLFITALCVEVGVILFILLTNITENFDKFFNKKKNNNKK